MECEVVGSNPLPPNQNPIPIPPNPNSNPYPYPNSYLTLTLTLAPTKRRFDSLSSVRKQSVRTLMGVNIKSIFAVLV